MSFDIRPGSSKPAIAGLFHVRLFKCRGKPSVYLEQGPYTLQMCENITCRTSKSLSKAMLLKGENLD